MARAWLLTDSFPNYVPNSNLEQARENQICSLTSHTDAPILANLPMTSLSQQSVQGLHGAFPFPPLQSFPTLLPDFESQPQQVVVVVVAVSCYSKLCLNGLCSQCTHTCLAHHLHTHTPGVIQWIKNTHLLKVCCDFSTHALKPINKGCIHQSIITQACSNQQEF